MRFPIRNTILITGASSGLGEGMAKEFARLGRNLALCARRLDRLEELKRYLLQINPSIRVSIRSVDVTNYEQVFEAFRAFADELGTIDRFIINAGLGKGQPLGTGFFAANRQTAETNFVAALAQCEAALEILRKQNAGHLVTVSSIAGLRGQPRNATTYAATKAGLASLTEGIRLELMDSPINVSTIFPGYIESEINAKVKNTPFIVDTATGCRAMVRAIERETAESYVPSWPWTAIGMLLRNLPLKVVARMS
ncbi:MAG TPA: SDR family oxidoreductase [Polyangiales bacterium]|nr:SDR family oxidoreductase [Polyangiales bacterium]